MKNEKLLCNLVRVGKLFHNSQSKLQKSGHWSLVTGHCLRGFTLIEVIVALAIVSISLVMVMQLFSGGLRASRTSCDYTRAIVHAKDKMEELSVEPVQSSGKFEDGFEWESKVQPYEGLDEELEGLGLNLLKIKVKISWVDTLRKKKSVELVSLKTIIEEGNE